MPENGRKLVAAAASMLLEARKMVESSQTVPLKAEILGDIDKAVAKARDLAGGADAKE